jgi:uncharacterized glyoxalase superfamily protein PhnB
MGFETRTANDAVIIKFDDFALCFIDESKAQIDKEVGIEPKGIGVFTYVEVENVDEQYEHVIENNLSPSSKPTSFPWGKREFAIKDPDGYKIVIYQDIEEK